MNPWFGGQPARFHGLMNQGATCYLNSVLQVLFMTKDFKDRVKRHKKNNAETEHIDSELSDLFIDLEQCEAYTFKVTKKLKITNVNEQRDAAEHYEKILRLTSPEASQIFHGELINRNRCLKCRTPSESVAGFWHLPLALVDSRDHYSVVKGIDEFFRSSEIRGEDQMYCQRCDEKCDAVLECEVKHHPEVLVLQLKRFEFDYRHMSYVKINCFVDVPCTLHIPQNQEYELYACVEHSGQLRYGHYISSIKSQDDGRWYIFDDSRVTESGYQHYQLDPTERSRTAYLLFYRRSTAQDADTVPPHFINSDTTEVSEVEIRTQDTRCTTEEKEGVKNDDHVHIKKNKPDKRVDQAAVEAQALAERTRNERRRDDCYKQFHDNCNLGVTGCSRNDSGFVCIDIPEDENTGHRFKLQSQTFNDRVTNTQWKEKQTTTKKTQEPCNIASADDVNVGVQTHMKDKIRIKEGHHGKHKQRGREDEAVKRQLLVNRTAHTPDLSSQTPEDQSETGAHVSAETRKEYETLKNDRDVQEKVSGNRFHRLSDKTCNTVSDRRENYSTNLGLSGVPVHRNYSRQTDIPVQTNMKDALSVKTTDDKHLDRRLKSSVRSDFGASVQDRGRTGFKGTVQRESMEDQSYNIPYSPQYLLSKDDRRVKEQRQNKNKRSGANYQQVNQTDIGVQPEEEGVETDSVQNLHDRQALEKRPLTNRPHQDRSRRQSERPEQEVSREASWSNTERDQRRRTRQWQEQSPSYPQHNTRHEPRGGGSRGNRSHDVTKSPEVLAEGVHNLKLSNQRDRKEEQKRREGKKRGSDRSRESETGQSGNKDAAMHKQGSLTADERQVQIDEEFETNQPRKRKIALCCFMPICKSSKKRIK